MEHRLDFQFQLAPCVVTGEFGKVIVTNLGEVKFELDNGETGEVEVQGQFSEAGLEMMLRALRAAPLPIPAQLEAVPQEVTMNLIYQWEVHYQNGQRFRQFDETGEHHLGEVDLGEVLDFVVRPRNLASSLPWFKLDRFVGLCRLESSLSNHTWQRLGLPLPEVPFHLQYQRRVTKVLLAGPQVGVVDGYPTHVRHELGWKVDTLHGDQVETTFMIGIEDDDGSWQIVKEEPRESRHLQNKRIEGSVRILELAEAPAGEGDGLVLVASRRDAVQSSDRGRRMVPSAHPGFGGRQPGDLAGVHDHSRVLGGRGAVPEPRQPEADAVDLVVRSLHLLVRIDAPGSGADLRLACLPIERDDRRHYRLDLLGHRRDTGVQSLPVALKPNRSGHGSAGARRGHDPDRRVEATE